MKRLLVTGLQGFVGTTLSRMLATETAFEGIQVADVSPELDLRNGEATTAMVANATPDLVIHLAAQSFIPESLRDPETTLNINLVGTLHLLQALKKQKFGGRMLFVGTGDVYGLVPEAQLPINEDRLPAPRNPYAVSKLAAEALCYQWTVSEGMEIVMARPFNHIGPGQSDRFAIAGFAHQLAEIRRGTQEPVIQAGELDISRDFTDVRDVVSAYFALLEKGVSGECYNVCSGIERTVRSILDRMVEIAGAQVEIRTDLAKLRAAEQRRAVGDANKIRTTTGWQATTPLDDSLAAMLSAA